MTTRRDFLRLAAAGMPHALRSQPRKPNFIFILADDLGYGDIGAYGAKDFRTSNIDRMAAEGMKFTSYYTPSPVCTPTRSSIMTGCYAVRVGLGYRVLFPYSISGLDPDEVTVAELLKTQDYATACIGKWHLGHMSKFLPTRQGFDYYFGIPYSNDMGNVDYKMIQYKSPPTPLMKGEQVIENDPDQRYLTRRYAEEAIRFMTENRDRPFFVYLAHNMPHIPIAVSEQFDGKSAHGKYGDVIEELDWSVGEILGAVKRLGLDENTMVIFTSDNGPVIWEGAERRGYRSGSAGPLRGAKGSTWEGGVRVPFVARWPGKIPKGQVCGEVAAGIDVLPTLAGLAGAPIPNDRIIDGRSIWPLLSGQAGAKSPHEVFYYYSNEELHAVRSGRWKLHIWRPEWAKERARVGSPLLFDLENDVGESNNVAASHPEIVRRLYGYAEKVREDLGDARRRKVGRNVRPVGQLER